MPSRLAVALLVAPSLLPAQSTNPPVRYQAEYTSIYSDDVEAVYPSVAPGFVLDSSGSFTSVASETISGTRSIKGEYSGTGSYTPYLHTDPAVLPLVPNRAYRVTFRYLILVTPNQGFEVLFYSPAGGSAGSFLPSQRITGVVGDMGTVALTNTLGPYADYRVQWNVTGTGAIAIDDIRITDMATGNAIADENAESLAPGIGEGLQFQNGATAVTNPALVLGGKASIRLRNYGTVATNPAVVSLLGNTTYLIEFQYRILERGSGDAPISFWMLPAAAPNWNEGGTLAVAIPALLKNAAAAGTFSTGAQTADAASYILSIHAAGDSDVIIDNIAIFRKDTVQTNALPPA